MPQISNPALDRASGGHAGIRHADTIVNPPLDGSRAATPADRANPPLDGAVEPSPRLDSPLDNPTLDRAEIEQWFDAQLAAATAESAGGTGRSTTPRAATKRSTAKRATSKPAAEKSTAKQASRTRRGSGSTKKKTSTSSASAPKKPSRSK